jgi:hypothetical protein
MLAPAVTVIHAALLVDVHAQLDPVVTAMLPLLPVEGTETAVGATLKLQLAAACVKVTVLPATLSVPLREAPVVFGATV